MREIRVTPADWPDAVADADGHQMIVAGPGTGKTEFLVHRVSHLITGGLARRDEVIVLCFSRRAAADLRKRIDEAVGATGVPVDATTFHSLALRLLEAASPGERLLPLTTPEQVSVVARLLDQEDPGDWPLTYRGIIGTPAFAAEVADFLMRCSERLLTPDDIEERAAQRPEWRGLPGLYRRYLEHLDVTGRTDYGTLLVSAAGLLGTESGRELAERFRYVLVDEYQDTSPVQAEIAELLAQAHSNLTVAGDPYQSIYSFRGAELRNISDFMDAHPDGKRLVLSPSFRVPADIMEAALRVVSGGDLPGSAGPVEPAPHHGRVETYVFDQETAEAEWIAKEVEHAIHVERMSPSSIAVLVRSKKELLNELSRALDRRRVPHDPPDTRLVDHPAVRLFQDLVTVAVSEDAASPLEAADADRAMRRILLGPLVGLSIGSERELLRLRRGSRMPWTEVIRANLVDRPGLAALLSERAWAEKGSAVDGFWHAWSTLEGIEDLVVAADRDEWRRAWTAFSQVLARQAERDPHLTLARFFELTEDEDFEATPLISHRLTTDRVTVTTLHQAKGLEFDVVFIANAVEGVYPDLRRSRRMLRPELLSPERTTNPHAQHLFQLQEEMRLAYTAMVRARLRVVWTATDAGVDQGEHRPSRFLIAAPGSAGLDIGPPQEPPFEPVTLGQAETALRRDLLDPTRPSSRRLAAARLLARPPATWWDPASFAGVAAPGPDAPILPETIRLSPSQAEAYSRCPRQYALERRLRLGDASSPYAQFGALIHSTLEKAEREVVGTGRAHADPERAIALLHEEWSQADFGTPELHQAWLRKGVEAITKLYERWPSKGIPVDLEKQVDSTIDGVPWTGFIDRVELIDEGLRVVDYKTSTQAISKDEAAHSVQLGFYARALGEDVVDAQMWYPRTSAKSVTTRSLDIGALQEVDVEIERITAAIKEEDWAPQVGAGCQRCSFRLSCPAWPDGKGAYLP